MGSGFHDFTPGEQMTADIMDLYLMRQTVMTFATTAARDAALTGVLDEGMVTYQEDTDGLTYYTGSAWRTWVSGSIAYTPTWSSTGSAPSLGNGTLVGSYRYVGGLVYARITLTFGTTTGAGTGGWRMTLPVTAVEASAPVGGGIRCVDASPTATYLSGLYLESTTVVLGLFQSTTANEFVGAAVPIAVPATSDSYRWTIIFEPA